MTLSRDQKEVGEGVVGISRTRIPGRGNNECKLPEMGAHGQQGGRGGWSQVNQGDEAGGKSEGAPVRLYRDCLTSRGRNLGFYSECDENEFL